MWAQAIASAADIGMGIWSAYQGKKAQEKANQQNIQEAQKSRDWQERMSNTAHQREVRDLKAAGLNPLLSVNTGASTTGGAMGRVESSAKDLAKNLITSALRSQIALNNSAKRAGS